MVYLYFKTNKKVTNNRYQIISLRTSERRSISSSVRCHEKRKMKTLICLISTIFIQTISVAQINKVFVLDKQASSITSSQNLFSIYQIAADFQDDNIKIKYWKENNWKRKSLGIGYRFLKMILIDQQIDHLTFLLQHEVFGHGYRYREFEFQENSYNINLAPPFGNGSGFARRGITSYNRKLGIHESIIISSGGMEANTILSKTIRNKWLNNGEINYRESRLYLLSILDYPLYIVSTNIFNRNEPGNDVNNYLRTLNLYHGYNNPLNYRLSINDITRYSIANLLNTYSLFAAYSFWKTYLFDGNKIFKYPMINLGKVDWLPSLRMGLSPFGAELILENHFKTSNCLTEVNLRIGDYNLNNFWGFGITHLIALKNESQLNLIADSWVQPSMNLGGLETFQTKKGLGGRIIGEFNLFFSKTLPVGIYGQVGYKTSGYIEGEKLDKGLILRMGISIKSNTTPNNKYDRISTPTS